MIKDKKIIFIIVLVVFICAIILFFVFRNSSSNSSEILKNASPITQEKGYDFRIFDDKILFTKISTSETGVTSSKFYLLDNNNPVKQSSSQSDLTFNNISNIIYSPDGSKVFFQYQQSDGSYTNAVFNLAKNEVHKLNPNIEDLIFSKDSNKLIYVYSDQEKSTLNISDPDGKNFEVIKNLDNNDTGYHIAMVGDKDIAYTKRHLASDIDAMENVSIINLDNRSENIIYSGFPMSQMLFSPDGKKVIANFALEVPISGAYNFSNNSSAIFFADYAKTEYTSAVWIDNDKALIAISDFANNQTYLLLLDLKDNQLKKYLLSSDTVYTVSNLQIVKDQLYYTIGDSLYQMKLSSLVNSSNWTLELSDVMKTPPDIE